VEFAPRTDANRKHRRLGIAIALTATLSKGPQKVPSLAQAAEHDLGRPLRSGQLGLQVERHKRPQREVPTSRLLFSAHLIDPVQAVSVCADLHCG
jgi:hypothetical protein